MANASVYVRNLDTGYEAHFESNDFGIYTAPELIVGSCTIQVEVPGFNVFNHTNFLLGDNNISSPSFGIAGGTHPPRNLQRGLKMSY